MKARRQTRSRAFTLLEVLVALAIFSLAGLVLASAYVNVLNAQEVALRRDDNESWLHLVRRAVRNQPDLLEAEKWNDVVLPDGGTARWKATVTPSTVADLFDVVVDIEMTPQSGGKTLTLSERCRLLRPTWSDADDRETLRAEAREKLSKRNLP